MLTYEEGLKQAQQIINEGKNSALPENLSSDLLSLIVTCAEDEESIEIELPLLLVVHLWHEDKFSRSSAPTIHEFYMRFKMYREACLYELLARNETYGLLYTPFNGAGVIYQ